MVAVIEKTIGNGLDYADLDTWEADTDNHLVNDDQQQWAMLGMTDSPYEMGNTTAIAGATTDATRYRGIKYDTGAKHDGTPGSGAVLEENSAGYAAIRHTENNFHVEGIEIHGKGVAFGIRTLGDYSLSVVDCLFYGADAAREGLQAESVTGAAAITVDNCFFQQFGLAAVKGNIADTDAVHCRHCTAVRDETDDNTAVTGFRYLKVTNVACFHYGGSGGHKDYLNLDVGSADYASSDNSGVPGLRSVIAVDQFVSITDDAMDLSLKAGSDLEEAGTGGVLGTDWEGDTRDAATPDIGADEYVVAGSESASESASPSLSESASESISPSLSESASPSFLGKGRLCGQSPTSRINVKVLNSSFSENASCN